MAGVAVAVAACGDPSASVGPHALPQLPAATHHVVSRLVDCEVTVESDFARPIGADAWMAPTFECSPSPDTSIGGKGADRIVFASDTILERFADIGFTYDTPTWSVVLGTGTMNVDISIVNHIATPIGTSDGVNPAANGTRVFIISGPTVLGGGLGTITISNATGTGTFTTTNQMYFQYSGIIQPGAASASVKWSFLIVTATKFNFQVGVDAITP
jgi:hypothetical protein